MNAELLEAEPAGDPQEVIARIHELGADLGYTRARVDRSEFRNGEGPAHKPTAWFEVGWGCGEIVVRWSDTSLFNGRYRALPSKVNYEALSHIFAVLAGWKEPNV